MLRKIVLILLATVSCNAQDIKKILAKATASNDSADYYFKIAKSQIKSAADAGQYYFCKTTKSSSNIDSVKYYGDIAIRKFTEAKDFSSLLNVYHNLALTYQNRGFFEKSIHYKLIALAKAEEIKDIKMQAFFCFCLSEAYHDFEDYEKGVEYGFRAYNLNLKLNPRNNIQIKNALNAIAINYDDWKKPELALKYHYKVFDFIKGKDTLDIRSTYNNIGNTLIKQKRYTEAEKWIKRALVILEENSKQIVDQRYFGSKSTVYVNLATIAFMRNDFVQAQRLFD
jgi:tetratricopeptide (TPR) repeat protein